jgi:hypothetical protein
MLARLGASLDGFAWRQRFSYLQYYRVAPSIHYEIWVQRKTARLEIGLHFEGERDANYAAAETLALSAPDVQARIGPQYELEEWTPQWTRLHRSFPAPALTPQLAEDAAGHAVALIRGMEPLLEAMSIYASLPSVRSAHLQPASAPQRRSRGSTGSRPASTTRPKRGARG